MTNSYAASCFLACQICGSQLLTYERLPLPTFELPKLWVLTFATLHPSRQQNLWRLLASYDLSLSLPGFQKDRFPNALVRMLGARVRLKSHIFVCFFFDTSYLLPTFSVWRRRRHESWSYYSSIVIWGCSYSLYTRPKSFKFCTGYYVERIWSLEISSDLCPLLCILSSIFTSSLSLPLSSSWSSLPPSLISQRHLGELGLTLCAWF